MHIPVLLKEVVEIFNPQKGQTYIDGTLGEGGHTKAILEKITPGGTLLGVDLDENALRRARERLNHYAKNTRLILIKGNYGNLRKLTADNKVEKVNGILLDLGFGSHTLENSGRGFSFLKDEPLDMRYGEERNLTAEELVNESPPEELRRIIKEYGEERWARRIAAGIVRERERGRISGSKRLAEIIQNSLPAKFARGRLHPATRTFQALRIVVNDELDNLRKALTEADEILAAGGRIIVISFHSLEDRIVKNFFREKNKIGCWRTLTKKPLRPTQEEIINNPRARSALLRATKKNDSHNASQ